MDVGQWLRKLGLEQYESAFRDNKIDSEILPKLTVEDLKDLGVALVGDRRRLLDAICSLDARVEPPVAKVHDTAEHGTGGSPPIAQTERRQLTVLFCDLVGSTVLSSRLDPEDLRRIIGAYHRCCSTVIGQNDGFVALQKGAVEKVPRRIDRRVDVTAAQVEGIR